MTSQITSPAENAELVRAGFRAFNVGDADECLALAAPDLITNLAELPEPQHGRETWRQGFEMIKHAFPRPAGAVGGHRRRPGQSRRCRSSSTPTTPANSSAYPRPAAPSSTSATSSTASPTGSSPKNGSAATLLRQLS